MTSLQDVQVLVVENDELNAMLLQLQLEGEGMHVAGVAPSVADALRLVEELQPQVVFLDYWLARNENSTPVAERLVALGTPFLVATGMDISQLPAVFNAGIKLRKPYTGADLGAALRRALAPA
ncbi:response regulator [Stenotrophomonas sp. ATCM1_4]|jgi:CheY-like chemotaxis protein|uniref:response regulator n=1 Tax=unclassified Stenotrophomonas TaxID=196198 RepID=UPI001045767B|nr:MULTISPECIES: response regulator [unclassified Stenotrophomonas]MBD9537702.1 response regulator [Stenotrophomonas sp. STM01]TDB27712.1 response regulator [Stenotrophomonas sp. ATCM1_4]